MPAFSHLKIEGIDAIIAYLETRKPLPKGGPADTTNLVKNPVPDTIAFSGLTLGISAVTQFPPSTDTAQRPLTRITKLDVQPGTDTLFINDLRGKLYKLQNNKPVVYMDLQKLVPRFINEPGLATGFGSFAIHPEFSTNHLMYTTHREPPGGS